MDRLITDTRLDPRFRSEAARVLKLTGKAGFSGEGTLPDLPPAVEKSWGKEGLLIKTIEIKSDPDGNKVKLALHRPRNEEVLPLVYHMHGGGMAIDSAFTPRIVRRLNMLAHCGVVVVSVDFRNWAQPSQPGAEIGPFPAGLNDCYSGLLWCHAHAAELGADPKRIIVAGESGGGNLSIATALKAKRDQRLDMIAGIYAFCPYIAGTWPQDVSHEGILGDSHITNNGISVTLDGKREGSLASKGYGGFGNPLAWPGFASVDDLKSLPHTMIVVNECDPLRDEGINFYRRCTSAGMRVQCRMVLGTPHAGDINVGVAPDLALESYRSVAAFARQPAAFSLNSKL